MWPRANLTAIFAGLCVIALVGLPNWSGSAESAIAGVIEAPLLLLGIWLAVRATQKAYFAGGGQPRLFALACGLVALFLVGQMAKSKKGYPFLPMRMYGTEAEGNAEFLVYEAKLSDGSSRKLRLGAAVPELGTARIARALERRLKNLPAPTNGENRVLSPEQREGVSIVRWLMLQENGHLKRSRSPAGQSVVIEEVLVYRVTIRPPYTSAHRGRTLLTRVSLHAS